MQITEAMVGGQGAKPPWSWSTCKFNCL